MREDPFSQPLGQPSASSLPERRHLPRRPGSNRLTAALRIKGQMGQLSVQVLDFNRFGLAARCQRPLKVDQIVFLTLNDGEHFLERVIGVVHNCLSVDDGYRCGIRFRTQSPLQFDRTDVEARLAKLEAALAPQPDQIRADTRSREEG